MQQWLIGTHHGVSREQLPMYLDEFVFRHNRRRQPMAAFQTLLGLGSGRKPTPYDTIRGAKDVLKHVLRPAAAIFRRLPHEGLPFSRLQIRNLKPATPD